MDRDSEYREKAEEAKKRADGAISELDRERWLWLARGWLIRHFGISLFFACLPGCRLGREGQDAWRSRRHRRRPPRRASASRLSIGGWQAKDEIATPAKIDAWRNL